MVPQLVGGVSLPTGRGDAEHRLEGVREQVFVLSTGSAHEVIQVDGPDHGASKAVLQQPLGLWETVRGPAGHPCSSSGSDSSSMAGRGHSAITREGHGRVAFLQ